jgi:hypothetical protein
MPRGCQDLAPSAQRIDLDVLIEHFGHHPPQRARHVDRHRSNPIDNARGESTIAATRTSA